METSLFTYFSKHLSLSCTRSSSRACRILNLVADLAWDLLVAACGHNFPDQESNPGPVHWELGVWAPGPPRRSLVICFLFNISGVLHGSIPAPLASWAWSVNVPASRRAPGSGGPCASVNTLLLLSWNSFSLSLFFKLGHNCFTMC